MASNKDTIKDVIATVERMYASGKRIRVPQAFDDGRRPIVSCPRSGAEHEFHIAPPPTHHLVTAGLGQMQAVPVALCSGCGMFITMTLDDIVRGDMEHLSGQ